MGCQYAGHAYSEGAVICINNGRYVCSTNEWRNDGNCAAPGWENEVDEALGPVISDVDGIRLTSPGPRRVSLVNYNDYMKVKIVTLKVYGSSNREGKFYVAKSWGYDIWVLKEGEAGTTTITKVEDAPAEGDQSAKQFLDIQLSGTPSIRNASPHYIYLSLDFASGSEANLPFPTAFMRLVVPPGKLVHLANGGETVKVYKWGPVTVQDTYLLG
ncbi:hypothetical protein ACQCLI_12845 [Pseudomonas nitroreducens]|uniref:hypothetical protein n=1 Tax=Pseudomonas nitroreducens TaxID=46680 RepID=UPI0012FE157A|nr:hypothetical protein [Pseudomonas nitroreducens]